MIFPVATVERGEEERGAVADVVMGLLGRLIPGRIGNSGRVRSNAWTWLFSSRQRTRRVIRRVQVQPHDVAHLLHEVAGRPTAEAVAFQK